MIVRYGTKLPFIGVVHVNDGQPDLFEWLNNHSDEQIKNIRGYCDNPSPHLGIYEKRIQDIFVCRVGIEKSYDQRNNNDSQKEAAQKDKQLLRNTLFSQFVHSLVWI
ncbi:MAG: hypothetical protein ACYCY7_09930 [Gallionella sp.]